MKRCPTCNRTFTDPNLSYCVEDGTPLIAEEEPVDESTVVSPYRPPAQYAPPGTAREKQRRVWPWVLGIFGAFGLGVAALIIAAVVLIPKSVRSVHTDANLNANANTSTNTNTNTETTDQPENVDAPPPADEAQVLEQLTAIEHEWTTANINADKKKLARILADDYVGPAPEGGLMGKTEYLATIERDTTIETWELKDLKLQLAGNRATLTGGITYFAGSRNISYNFTDRFVWRNGRWQATGSEIQRKE